jgi:uncharacterized membrane protein YeaQ/YmgE (transglycosylase-associated protein family)
MGERWMAPAPERHGRGGRSVGCPARDSPARIAINLAINIAIDIASTLPSTAAAPQGGLRVEALLYTLIVGLIAGFLASLIMKTGKRSLLVYLILGVVGAAIGTFLFRLFGLSSHGLIGSIVVATAGAAILIWLVDLLGRTR